MVAPHRVIVRSRLPTLPRIVEYDGLQVERTWIDRTHRLTTESATSAGMVSIGDRAQELCLLVHPAAILRVEIDGSGDTSRVPQRWLR